ncbi:MAG TPA: CBS domain-containing protein [Phnomibacter sp.]|nr:CBS domain-containing protein [Phnomibacter sp.]
MKTAADILLKQNAPNNYVAPDTLVSDALTLLNALNRIFLVVVDGDDFKGIFSEHDFVKNVAVRGWDANVCAVGEVMRMDFPMATMDTQIEDVIGLMHSHAVPYLPVFDGRHFEGVITLHDITALLIEYRETVFDLESSAVF